MIRGDIGGHDAAWQCYISLLRFYTICSDDSFVYVIWWNSLGRPTLVFRSNTTCSPSPSSPFSCKWKKIDIFIQPEISPAPHPKPPPVVLRDSLLLAQNLTLATEGVFVVVVDWAQSQVETFVWCLRLRKEKSLCRQSITISLVCYMNAAAALCGLPDAHSTQHFVWCWPEWVCYGGDARDPLSGWCDLVRHMFFSAQQKGKRSSKLISKEVELMEAYRTSQK